MAVIEIKREHGLGIEEIRKRVDKLAEDLHQALDADYSWKGNTLSFKRTGASGSIELTANTLAIKVKLGVLHSTLKGRIEKVLDDHLDEVLT